METNFNMHKSLGSAPNAGYKTLNISWCLQPLFDFGLGKSELVSMKDLEAYFYTFLCKPILGQDTLYSGQCKQIIYHYKCNELITN